MGNALLGGAHLTPLHGCPGCNAAAASPSMAPPRPCKAMPSRKAAAPAVKPSFRRPTDRPQERIPCGPAKLAPPPKGAGGLEG